MTVSGQFISLMLAAAFYALAAVFCFGAVADEKKERAAFLVILLAFLAHSVAFGLRAVEAGRLPGLGLYEVLLGYTWVGSAIFLLVIVLIPHQYGAGLAAMPVLALGMAFALLIAEAPPLAEPYFYSIWFYIHTLTAYTAFGLILCGTALGLVLLLKEKVNGGKWLQLHKFLPPRSLTDFLSWRLIGMGFVSLGAMIVSGGVWANQAWGRYWAWDPIETWSLISWLLYGILLHLRRLHGWHGEKAAILQAGAFAVLVFTLLFIGLVYPTIHRAYF